jgi:hypothetical protein
VNESRSDTPNGDLEARLARALHDGLGGHVEVGPLLHGARAGAQRIRRRRTAAAGVRTAMVLLAVPLGLATMGDGRPEGPFASATATTPPEPTAEPTASAEPSSLAAPESFPNSIAFADSDFDRPMSLTLDLGNYANIPPVSGQSCDVGSNAERPMPLVGRTWSWDDAASDRMEQRTVQLSVTGWENAAEAIADIRQDSGFCTFLDTVTERPSGDLPGEGAWVGSSTANGLTSGYAVARLGQVLVAVTVNDPEGEAAATEEAKRLVVIAAERTAAALD